MASRQSRLRPASSPTPFRKKSSWRPATKRPRCCRRSRRRAEVAPRDVVLVIDNYDSFTYNLVQYLGELGEQVVVRRNDEITLGEITELQPVAAVLSPGPGTPGDLEVTAWTEDGTVMGLRHRQHPLAGVQFHPEAILTEHGHQLLANFLQDARAWRNTNATVRDPIAE